MDAAAGRKALLVSSHDQVDRNPAGDQRDIGMFARRFFQRLLHGPTSRIVDMDNPAVGMTALARQMPLIAFARIERHAQCREPGNGFGRALDDKLDRLPVIEAGSCNHRVFDMAFKSISGFKNGGDSALCPACRAVRKPALGQHANLELLRQGQGGCQPRSAGPEDQHIETVVFSHSPRA